MQGDSKLFCKYLDLLSIFKRQKQRILHAIDQVSEKFMGILLSTKLITLHDH